MAKSLKNNLFFNITTALGWIVFIVFLMWLDWQRPSAQNQKNSQPPTMANQSK